MKSRAFTLVDILVIISVFAIVAALLLPCAITIGGNEPVDSVIVSVSKSFVVNGNEMYIGTDKGVFRVRARRGPDEPSSVELFSRLAVGNTYEVGVLRSRKIPQIVSVGGGSAVAVEEDAPAR